jgi:hypothetical protein
MGRGPKDRGRSDLWLFFQEATFFQVIEKQLI